MTRYNLINGKKVAFTVKEEKQADADLKAWNDGKADRRMAELRRQRDVLLAETDWIVIKARENNATVPSAW